jgi:hypothetical protein
MTEAKINGERGIGERGIAALHSTRSWAKFVGVVAIVGGVISIINTAVVLWFPRPLPANAPQYLAGMRQAIGISGIVFTLVVYGLAAWFALAYGRGLTTGLSHTDGSGLEAALWWQRRYWTLQGVLTIVAIVVLVLLLVTPFILFVVGNVAAT